MSILIKGMEMPSEGEYRMTLYVCSDGSAYIDVASFPVDEDRFKAVPVPPHGRLIDAEAYESLLRGLGDRNYRREKGTICDAVKFLHPHYAPTIIPADPAEEEPRGNDEHGGVRYDEDGNIVDYGIVGKQGDIGPKQEAGE